MGTFFEFNRTKGSSDTSSKIVFSFEIYSLAIRFIESPALMILDISPKKHQSIGLDSFL